MSAVEDFIASQEENGLNELMQYLHDLLADNPGITFKMRYKVPFYYRHSWICYLNPQREGGVEMAFIRGNELSNIQGILEARGRSQVRGIILKPGEPFPDEAIREVIQEALLLDETIPYASKRKPGKEL